MARKGEGQPNCVVSMFYHLSVSNKYVLVIFVANVFFFFFNDFIHVGM